MQLYTGLGLTEDSDLRVRVPGEGFDLTFSRVCWEDYSLSRPSIPYIGFRAGRFLERRPWLGLAIDVIHYKVFARTDRLVDVTGTFDGSPVAGAAPLGQFVQRYNVGNGVNMYLLTALARLRRGRSDEFPDGRWRPYAGLGVGPTLPYTHSTVLGNSRKGYEAGKAGGPTPRRCRDPGQPPPLGLRRDQAHPDRGQRLGGRRRQLDAARFRPLRGRLRLPLLATDGPGEHPGTASAPAKHSPHYPMEWCAPTPTTLEVGTRRLYRGGYAGGRGRSRCEWEELSP